MKIGIEFDTENCSGMIRKPGGQTSGSGADFENRVFPVQFRGSNDEIDEVEVNEEILSHLVLGGQPMRHDEVANIGECLPGVGSFCHTVVVQKVSPMEHDCISSIYSDFVLFAAEDWYNA